MMSTMRLVDHDPRLGVLCWGGPKNGEVVPIRPDQHVVRFPIQRRLTARSFEAAPMAPVISTVEYRVEKFAIPWNDGTWERWRVLVYPENLDTQKRQLEAAAKFIVWLAGQHST